MALPGGTFTIAASSGACSPTNTSSRSTGFRLPSARDKTVEPTLAPQPPQRMAIAEMACRLSSCVSAKFGVLLPAVGFALGSMSGKSLNFAMKRRSIQSFHCHTQAPAKPSEPLEATAYLSPVLIKASQVFWGRYSSRSAPCTNRCKFLVRGLPMRTANTPAFSSGVLVKFAMSPAAKILASRVVCRVGPTLMKPRESSSRSVFFSQAAPPACVTHIISSACRRSPCLVCRVWPSSCTTSASR